MSDDEPESAAATQLALEFAAPPVQGCEKCGLKRKHTDEECADWAAWRAAERLRFFSLEW